MISIESIEIEKFRGIKGLSIDLRSKSFAVSGDNGSGKSGVVDAIEFALTGSLTRLTGKGLGDVSVKEHGPHVDSRTEPTLSKVSLRFRMAGNNQLFTLSRSVSNARSASITPKSKPAEDAIKDISAHPEFFLSRREIVKFILTSANDRAGQIQALLKLESIEKIRASLQSICNDKTRSFEAAGVNFEMTKSRLASSLEVAELKKEAILAQVNARRHTLGFDPILELRPDTNFFERRTTKDFQPRIDKATASKVIDQFETSLGAPEFLFEIDEAKTIVQEAVADQDLFSALRKIAFLRLGVTFLSAQACPFCELPWDLAELRALIEEKLKASGKAEGLKRKAATSNQNLIKRIIDLETKLENLAGLSPALKLSDEQVATLNNWKQHFKDLRDVIRLEKVDENTSQVLVDWQGADELRKGLISEMRKRTDKLPEISKEDVAREFLFQAQEHLQQYTNARSLFASAKIEEKIATTALDEFVAACSRVLNSLYISVENDFCTYYKFLNSDEGAFSAKLTPTPGNVDLKVEFYGRGLFPPSAYHSEGHQDGMGLCLYLALMKQVYRDSLSFLVLDDVLMSVDTGHRRKFCELLSQHFPKIQLIITTHDRVWQRQLVSNGIVSDENTLRFSSWTPESGPLTHRDSDVWAAIDEDLFKNDVSGASHKLRHGLEFFAEDLAGKLKARVEFRPDGNYDLAILADVTSRWKDLLTKAIAAEKSWGHDVSTLEERLRLFREAVAASQVEQWAINKSVHYNAWAQLHVNDFSPMAATFKTLLNLLRCQSCAAFFYVASTGSKSDSIRCKCSSLANLIGKPVSSAVPMTGSGG